MKTSKFVPLRKRQYLRSVRPKNAHARFVKCDYCAFAHLDSGAFLEALFVFLHTQIQACDHNIASGCNGILLLSSP